MTCIFKWSKSIGVILIINEDIKCDICRALFYDLYIKKKKINVSIFGNADTSLKL